MCLLPAWAQVPDGAVIPQRDATQAMTPAPGEEAQPTGEPGAEAQSPDDESLTPEPAGSSEAPINAAPEPPPLVDPLSTLVQAGVFPEEALTSTEPLTRARLADVMVRALHYPTRFVSEFPFYRDVPREYWAYVPIEVARLRNLLIPPMNGFFFPDMPATHMVAYWGLSNALTSRTLSPESAKMLLEPFADREQLNERQARPVALLVNARIIPLTGELNPETHTSSAPMLRPNEPITYQALAPMLARLVDVTSKKSFFLTQTEEERPDIAAGTLLEISPSNAIFKARLDVGDTVYFTLEQTDAGLPKGSRLRGSVIGLTPDQAYQVRFTELRTPQDQYWDLWAVLELTFPGRDDNAFIVPGERFEIMTQSVPATEGTSGFPSSVPPPAQPAASSGSTSAPNSVPRSPESSESAP